MKVLIFTLFIVSVICEEATETPPENVVVGTADNWEELVNENTNALVEFYAPWCGHCKHLEPEYEKAAAQLKEEQIDVTLVKIDATVEKDLAQKFGVRGFPTLKFFKKGQTMEYTGGRTQDTIVSWVTKKLGPPAIDLASSKEITSFAAKHEAVVIGFFDDRESEFAKQFLLTAGELEDESFGIAKPEDSGDLGITKPSVVVLKKFDKQPSVYEGDGNYVSIRAFIQKETRPNVMEFNSKNQKKIFGGDTKLHIFLCQSKKDVEEYHRLLAIFQEVAAEYKQLLVFVTIESDISQTKRLLEYIDVKEAPAVRLLDQASGDAKKYIFKGEITVDSLTQFVKDFNADKLEVSYKSADEPEDWDAQPVKILVGTSFDRVVKATGTNALVEFYAPWCGHCKKLSPIWDELAENVKETPNLVIAKVDSTENEVAGMSIKSFPTLKYFTSDGEVLDYKGGRTLEDLTQFLREKLGEGLKEKPTADETPATEEILTEEKKEVPVRVDL